MTDSQVAIFYRTFQDAIYLARHTALYWPCDAANDEVFNRYFEPGDAEFVKNIFRAIANIDFNLDLSDPEIVKQLADEPLTYNEKFTRLSIYFLGDHPGLTQPGIPESDLDCKGSYPWLAYVVPTFGGASALMSVCKLLYQQEPMLQDVEKAPNWAIDPKKDQSKGPQYYDGYGCQNLGNIDTRWMYSTGSVLMHELLHFPGLFADVPDYDANIATQFDANTPHFISDFYGDWPENGYGPYNAAEIKRYLPRDHQYLQWKPTYNADNYVCYALSKYYSRVCGRPFAEAPSADAAWPSREPPSNPFP
ncbi:uncharacterized protein PV07_07450 [Cladophialophora immunda]|uniref:Lysine-specific metallo-endopeptidase domain-containing protein n=1 Tax=Cladophialophora immunda TaxID=569365 RepID=A0A0D2CBF0_9EURO|nr:uncharacterized protein PV07_07450 [Cladophialophora immunda]KIW27740.1 hypothetical protein PV07_07450 [Cladophialophora immunda]OQV10050.1 hypothetical protein CLAIMM_14103 [Cladophialophora immunda]